MHNLLALAKLAFRDGFRRGQRTGDSFAADNSAQSNLIGLVIGATLGAVMVISVFIPVVNEQIANSNITGTPKTILDLLPLFAALLLLIMLATPLMRRS